MEQISKREIRVADVQTFFFLTNRLQKTIHKVCNLSSLISFQRRLTRVKELSQDVDIIHELTRSSVIISNRVRSELSKASQMRTMCALLRRRSATKMSSETVTEMV